MKKHVLPFAEDVNYWQSGKSAPDVWIDRTKKELAKVGGRVLVEAFGSDENGRSAYMLSFSLDGDTFRIVWPVLPSRRNNDKAARIQAATMMHHDVKGRCVAAAVLGNRAAFLNFILLPDGRTANDVATPDLAQAIPALFRPAQIALPSGEAIEGEVV